jgi:transposase InsO family protein
VGASGRGTIVCCEVLVRPLRALISVIEALIGAARKRTSLSHTGGLKTVVGVGEPHADRQALERVCRQAGQPQSIPVDQGSEFISRDLDLWACQKGVVLDFTGPGKPTDNALITAGSGPSA